MAQQLLNAVFIGSIYALFAVGYTIVFGVLDVLNLAHSAVFMMGAVICYSLVALHGTPFFLAAALAMVACGLLGLLIEYAALRPLRRRGAPQISALISTIGLALILVAIVEQAHAGGLFGWLWTEGANSARFPASAVPNPTLHAFGLTFEGSRLMILATTILLLLLLGYVIRYSQVGRALRAVAENPRAALLLGIDVDRIFALTLFVSSALGGLAGILFGVATSNIDPYIGRDQVELKGLAIIVLGGMGSIPGAVVGGYLIGIVETFALVLLGGNYRVGVAFLALFAMLIVRPQGLLGTRARDRL